MFNTKTIRRKETGFSLLELSVAVGIAAVVATAGIVATTVFMNNAGEKRDSYTANANASIEEAESASVALGLTPVLPPSSPTVGESTIITQTSATITWAAPPSSTVEGYRVKLDNTTVAELKPDVFAYQITGLEAGEEYVIDVYAYNETGESSAASLNITTDPKTLLAPDPVTNIAFSNTTLNSTDVSWTAPTNIGNTTTDKTVASYKILVDGELETTLTADNLTYSLTDLTLAGEYSVSVVAVNSAGDSTTNPSASLTMPTIQATGGTATNIVDNGFVYRVHTFTNVGNSTFNVTEAPAGSELEYLIIAGGGGGEGDPSTGASAAGGGAGGYRTNVPGDLSGGSQPTEPALPATIGDYNVIVGAGGVRGTGGNRGGHGESSSFGDIIALLVVVGVTITLEL